MRSKWFSILLTSLLLISLTACYIQIVPNGQTDTEPGAEEAVGHPRSHFAGALNQNRQVFHFLSLFQTDKPETGRPDTADTIPHGLSEPRLLR